MCEIRIASIFIRNSHNSLQHVEYFIDKGVLGESKSLVCTVFEHKYVLFLISSLVICRIAASKQSTDQASKITKIVCRSPPIAANTAGKYDSTLETPICLPVVPPTLVGVCRLVQIYYNLKVIEIHDYNE